jgi:outer membrane lipoprotein carrier protein
VASLANKIRTSASIARPALLAALLTTASIGAIFGDGGARIVPQEVAAAETADLKAVLAQLQHHYQETNSFSASFKQTVTRVGAPPKDRIGTVYYQKPGRIRFEFTEPQPETIVSDGTLLHDYDPGLNQVMETPLKNAIKTQAAAAFLLGVGNVKRDFKATLQPSAPDDGLTHILLTPKHGGDAIEVGLDEHTMNIMSMRLVDALGNVTKLQFSDIQTNVSIEPSRFEFKTPAGADVVTSSGAPGTQ